MASSGHYANDNNIDLNDVLRDLDEMLGDEDEYDTPQSHLSQYEIPLPPGNESPSVSQASSSPMFGSPRPPLKLGSYNPSPTPPPKTLKPFCTPPPILKAKPISYSPSPIQSPTPPKLTLSFQRVNKDEIRQDTPAPFNKTAILLNSTSSRFPNNVPTMANLDENYYISENNISEDLSFENRDYVNVAGDDQIFQSNTYDLPLEVKPIPPSIPQRKVRQSENLIKNNRDLPTEVPKVPPRKGKQNIEAETIYDVPNKNQTSPSAIRKDSVDEIDDIYDEVKESNWRDSDDGSNEYSEPMQYSEPSEMYEPSCLDVPAVDKPGLVHTASARVNRQNISKLQLGNLPPSGSVKVMLSSASSVPSSAPVGKFTNCPMINTQLAPETSPPKLNSLSYGIKNNQGIPSSPLSHSLKQGPSLSRSITAIKQTRKDVPLPNVQRSASIDTSAMQGRSETQETNEESNVYELESEYSEPMVGEKDLETRRPSDNVVSTLQAKQDFLRQTSTKMSLQSNLKKVIVNVYNVDNSYKTIIINEKMRARDVCELLIVKNHFKHSVSWQLVESLMDENLEREIEDHEIVVEIYETWSLEKNNRFLFRQNFKKFEVFQNPTLYLNNYCTETSGGQTDITDKMKQAKAKLMNEMFLQSDKVAELSGHLWVKEPGRKWRELFCYLRRSGLYYSTRANNKNPKYQYIIIDFSTANIYTSMNPSATKKCYNAPTKEIMIFKNTNLDLSEKETVCVCALDRNNFLCWQQGFRLSKFGVQDLRRNYLISSSRHEKLKELSRENETPSPKPNNSRFEFGHKDSTSDLLQQSWYHGQLSKDAASQRVLTYAQNDGSFLVREFDRQFFISLKFMDKIHHIKLQQVPLAGKCMWTIEAGLRNFPSLIDLVNYYNGQQGSLPCVLGVPIDNSLSC